MVNEQRPQQAVLLIFIYIFALSVQTAQADSKPTRQAEA
jgi:hypothetical protein